MLLRRNEGIGLNGNNLSTWLCVRSPSCEIPLKVSGIGQAGAIIDSYAAAIVDLIMKP